MSDTDKLHYQDEIRKALATGKLNVAELSKELGITPTSMRKYALDFGRRYGFVMSGIKGSPFITIIDIKEPKGILTKEEARGRGKDRYVSICEVPGVDGLVPIVTDRKDGASKYGGVTRVLQVYTKQEFLDKQHENRISHGSLKQPMLVGNMSRFNR